MATQISRKRLVVYSIVTVLLFVGGGLALLEGALRLYIHVQYGVPGKTYGLWRSDEILGARHRENAYNTNSQTNDHGFRNAEDVLNPKPEGSLRIITYGGSTTYCYNLSNDEAWPLQLQRALRERRHPHDQVLNGGAIMWSLGHALARARDDIPRLRPDYIIIYSGINEKANADYLALSGSNMADLVERGEYGRFAKNLDQNRWVKRNLALVRLLDYVIKPALSQFRVGERTSPTRDFPELDSVVLHNYLHVLQMFIDLAMDYGAIPVFVVQVHSGSTPLGAALTEYSRQGAAFAADLGAIVVDASSAVASYEGDPVDLFSVSGVHYSREGSQLLAEFLYGEIFVE